MAKITFWSDRATLEHKLYCRGEGRRARGLANRASRTPDASLKHTIIVLCCCAADAQKQTRLFCAGLFRNRCTEHNTAFSVVLMPPKTGQAIQARGSMRTYTLHRGLVAHLHARRLTSTIVALHGRGGGGASTSTRSLKLAGKTHSHKV